MQKKNPKPHSLLQKFFKIYAKLCMDTGSKSIFSFSPKCPVSQILEKNRLWYVKNQILVKHLSCCLISTFFHST